MSQADLARKSGVSRETISRIETGSHEDPRPATLRDLAGALGVRPLDLVVGPALLAASLGITDTAPVPHRQPLRSAHPDHKNATSEAGGSR